MIKTQGRRRSNKDVLLNYKLLVNITIIIEKAAFKKSWQLFLMQLNTVLVRCSRACPCFILFIFIPSFFYNRINDRRPFDYSLNKFFHTVHFPFWFFFLFPFEVHAKQIMKWSSRNRILHCKYFFPEQTRWKEERGKIPFDFSMESILILVISDERAYSFL